MSCPQMGISDFTEPCDTSQNRADAHFLGMSVLASEKHGSVKSFRPTDKIFPVFIYFENTLAFSVPANRRSHLQYGVWQGS